MDWLRVARAHFRRHFGGGGRLIGQARRIIKPSFFSNDNRPIAICWRGDADEIKYGWELFMCRARMDAAKKGNMHVPCIMYVHAYVPACGISNKQPITSRRCVETIATRSAMRQDSGAVLGTSGPKPQVHSGK